MPPGNSAAVALLPKPERLSPETNRPHCYFDCHSVKNNKSFRFVIRVRPDKAPFMSENFIQLTLGKRGFGYKGKSFRQHRNFKAQYVYVHFGKNSIC